MTSKHSAYLRNLINAIGRDLAWEGWTADERRALKLKLRAAEIQLSGG